MTPQDKTAAAPAEPVTPPLFLEVALSRTVIAGHLSKRTAFSIQIDGPFNKAEQDALRLMLDAQLSVLEAV